MSATFIKFIISLLILFIFLSISCLLWDTEYSGLLIKISEMFLSDHYKLKPDGADILIYYDNVTGGGVRTSHLHIGVIIFVSLMLATPGISIKHKSLFLLLGMIVLIIIHSGTTIVTTIHFVHARFRLPYNGYWEMMFFERSKLFLSTIGNQLFPVLI